MVSNATELVTRATRYFRDRRLTSSLAAVECSLFSASDCVTIGRRRGTLGRGLKRRGLRGVIFAVSDDHPGLKRAIAEVLPEAYWQRCYVHFLRNALDYLPRKVADDCLIELRWLYDRRNAEEARRDLAAWLLRWQEKYPKLCAWVEENIEETLTFYRLPREHHKHLKSTNMLERLNQEIKRRTHVIRIFPNEESALRLIRALAVEIHEDWIEAHRYLNMEMLREQNVSNFNSWRPPKVNAPACSQTGSSGVAPAPELCPSGSGCRYLALPGVYEQASSLFPTLTQSPFC